MAFNKAKAMQEAEKLVSLRKTADAIKQYLRILDKDPADVSILNTVGDLYVRENNKGEALKCFHRLAEAFTRDGFTVKAIAIYKKISKMDPAAIDPTLKLAELYSLQGLNREAREQYNQAAEYFRKKGQADRALDAFRKIVALDPENRAYRTRLAELAEQMGRKDEAAVAYLEVAESALRADDAAAAEPALQKSLQLEPKSSQAQLLQARLAAGKKDYARVEQILTSDPALKGGATGRQLLLDAYLATQRIDAAEGLVVDVVRSKPEDFAPLASFTRLCLGRGSVDTAVKALSDAADLLIEKKQGPQLMDTLRQIWSKNPDHMPMLELVLRVTEKTNDETTLPEILGALGHVYEQSGELEKAEGAYRKLVQREPTNEDYRCLLNGVLQKQGKEVAVPLPVALGEVELEVPEVEAVPAVDSEQVAVVKEALENSDLFSRYGLIDKAVAELEKVLGSYPEQVDIHRRIFEVCHRTQPARAGKAAEALARIYRKQGDRESAKQYEDVVTQLTSGAPGAEVALPAVGPVRPPETPTPPPSAPVEVDLSEAFVAPVAEQEEVKAEEPAPQEIPVDLTAPVEVPIAPAPPQEMDLSADFAAFTGEPAVVEAPPPEAPGVNFEDARVEVEFYLSQGFVDEARSTVQALAERFPGEAQVATLRQLVEAQAAGVPKPVETPAVEPEIPVAYVEPTPPPVVPEAAPEAIGAVAPPVEPAPAPVPVEPQRVGAPPPVVEAAPAAGGDLLGSLVSDLEQGLGGIGEAGPPLRPSQTGAQPPPVAEEASPLSGWLDELGEATPGAAAQDDPETHYNLGVAFREMGLLDEAIGEFQKVVKGVQKEHYPPNFLQACSLLAVSFMDKGMPQIASKWYMRALETPELDEESTLALQYDLGVAYEQAGDTRKALEKFSEVYSQNIDYRDVAEKIRALQQKAR